jgi:tetratricopeptide (TPR) repeat protein
MYAIGYFPGATTAIVFLTMPAAAEIAPRYRTCTGTANVDWDGKSKAARRSFSRDRRQNAVVRLPGNNRDRAYHLKKDYDRAIADQNEAIRINPKYVYA